MKAFLFLLISALAVASTEAGEVPHLIASDFKDAINEKAAFIKFYAPWCGHCKKLAPDYQLVYDAYQKTKEVVVAKVDCTVEDALCKEYGVTGYPTLKFFPKGSSEPESYTGGRTAEDILNFLAEKTGISATIAKPKSFVIDVSDATFDDVVLDESKFVLAEFYAPWCGHCKSLAPVYDELSRVFQNEKDVVIAKIDADSQKEKASLYGVSGFPTLKFFPKNNEVEDYSSGRDLESLVQFINEKAGTQRLPNGKLNEKAGVVEELVEKSKDFITADDEERKSFMQQVQTSEGIDTWTKKVYLSVMQKISEKGEEYVATETSRLQNMIESGSVNPQKIDEFTKRINVLNSFSA